MSFVKTYRASLSAFLVAASLGVPSALFALDQARVVEMIADSDNTFKVTGEKQPILRLHVGELVKLRITSKKGEEAGKDGAAHSLVIRDLRDEGWNIRLFEGTHDYELRAPQQPGEYLAECTVYCGRGHQDMQLKVVVEK